MRTFFLLVLFGIMCVVVGCSSGSRFYIGKEGIGMVVDRKFSVSNGCITVDSPFDLILRSTEYGKRLKIKDSFGVSADVAYDSKTGVATTNWCYQTGVYVTKTWHGCEVSGGLTFRGDDAALAFVGCTLARDRKMSVKSCVKLMKEIIAEVEERTGVPMRLQAVASEDEQIARVETLWEEDVMKDRSGVFDFLRYGATEGEGYAASEYLVIGHVDREKHCCITFDYGVAGELRRGYILTPAEWLWEEACAYRDGAHGRKKDLDKSRELFLKAGEQHAQGSHIIDMWRVEWIGEWYEKGNAPFSQDDKEALKWYCTAAGMGSSECMRKIASCYQEGKGVGKDVFRAQRWRNKAEEEELTHVSLDGELPRPRYGKVNSFTDLKIGTTDVFVKNRQFLRSSCHTELEWGEDLKKIWSHAMSVRLAKPFHGFDRAELSFVAPNMELASCVLRCSTTPSALSEEECLNEVSAIAEEMERSMGIIMERQALSDKEEDGVGRVIASYHGIAGKDKTRAQYSLTGLRDAKGRYQISLFVSSSAWGVFSDAGSRTECAWEWK